MRYAYRRWVVPAFRQLTRAGMVSFLFVGGAYANTAIETETAQLGKQGEWSISNSLEYGKAKDGTSGQSLTQFEYAITDRAEILIEPFFYVWDHPKGERRHSGAGDYLGAGICGGRWRLWPRLRLRYRHRR